MFDSVTLGDLRLVVAVIDEGSITSAAQRVGIPVPTASRRLRSLEEQVGRALVHRTTRKVFLTPDGEALLPLIRTLVAQARELADHLRQEDGPHQAALRVTVPAIIAGTVLGRALAKLRVREPSLRFEIRVRNEPVDLMRDELDVAIRIGRVVGSPDVLIRRVGTLSLVLAASGAHGPVPAVETLLSGALLLAPIDIRALAGALGVSEARVRAATTAVVGDRLAIRDAVMAGAGVGLLPALLSEGLVRVLPELKLPIGGVFTLSLPALQADRRVAAFADAIRDELAARQAVEPGESRPMTDEQPASSRAGETPLERGRSGSGKPCARSLSRPA